MAAKKEPVRKYKPPLDCEVDHDEQGLQIILCGNLDMNGRPARAKATYAEGTAMRAYCPQCGYGFVYYSLESHCWTCEMCGRILQNPNPRQVLARFVYDATIPKVKAMPGAAPAPPRPPERARWRIEEAVAPGQVPFVDFVDNNNPPPWNVNWQISAGNQGFVVQPMDRVGAAENPQDVGNPVAPEDLDRDDRMNDRPDRDF